MYDKGVVEVVVVVELYGRRRRTKRGRRSKEQGQHLRLTDRIRMT